MVRRAVLGTPEHCIPAADLVFSSLQGSTASGSQKDGPTYLAVDQFAESSSEHSAHARARHRDIAQRSIARSEGSAVATFNHWWMLTIARGIHEARSRLGRYRYRMIAQCDHQRLQVAAVMAPAAGGAAVDRTAHLRRAGCQRYRCVPLNVDR